MPNLYIVAGPNGAGKSTYFRRFLRAETSCREFVNADVIAAEISPHAPEKAAFEAGRIMHERYARWRQSGWISRLKRLCPVARTQLGFWKCVEPGTGAD